MTFAPAFAGVKNHYLQVQTNAGLYTGWQPVGTWAVPGPPPGPDFSITTPINRYYISTGAAATATYTVSVTPVNGFSGPVTFIADPLYGCSNVAFSPVAVSELPWGTTPAWTTTLTMSCTGAPIPHSTWTTVTAFGGGKGTS